MIEIAELEELIALLKDKGIASLEIADAQRSLRLVMQATEQTSVASADLHEASETADRGLVVVRAKLPGIFLDQHPLRPAPFAPIGDRISAGDILGLVRVGPIYSPVAAPVSGTVGRRLAEPQSLVEFGTPLFELDPAATPE